MTIAKKKKKEFSKVLLIQESALVWLITIAGITLAFICVFNGYLGSLPWLATMITGIWAAYGVSQACYYNKSKKENSQGGIVYDMAMAQLSTQGTGNNDEENYQI